MQTAKPENHPFKPFMPRGAKLLMLGSFPPKATRRSMDFYYPNFQNDMWRIFGLIFFKNKDALCLPALKTFDLEKITALLNSKKIALYDVAESVLRLNADSSDKFLQISKPADLRGLLNALPQCPAVASTGAKSAQALAIEFCCQEPPAGGHTEFEFECPAVRPRKMRFYRMPSSSRAYPMPIAEKAARYAAMFEELKML